MNNSVKTPPWVRTIASLAACTLALAALGSASSARAGTLSVSNLNDSGPGSLRQAIASAAQGDTITFGVKGTINLTSGALVITQDLDIEGPGPNKLKISGNHASRVFVIQSGTVTLAGMAISDGLADVDAPILASIGGGILNFASLTLANDVISDNTAIGSGYTESGGVANYFGASLHVTASQFIGNLARAGDGVNAGLGVGGGIGSWGTIAIADSRFIGNVAQGGSAGGDGLAGPGVGGAIGNANALVVFGSTFSHNVAIGGNDTVGLNPAFAIGGAIYTGGMGNSEAMLVASNSSFDHNQSIGGNGQLRGADAGGGAIDVGYGFITITSCTLDHNEVVGGAAVSSGNGGSAFGGAVNEKANGTISNSTVEHNTALGGPGAPGGNGGDGWGGGLTAELGGTFTVSTTTVAHNEAQGGAGGAGGKGGNGLGGGLHNDASSTLTLAGATVRYNLAFGGIATAKGVAGQGIGGGVYRLGTYSADSATVIEKNQAKTSNDNVGP